MLLEHEGGSGVSLDFFFAVVFGDIAAYSVSPAAGWEVGDD